MAYITPIHFPSGVRNALKLHLIDPEQEILALGRSNRVELYTINAEEPENVLQLISSTRILGRVTTLNKFRPAESRVDHLLIGTDLYNYFTMHWDTSSQTLVITEKSEMDLHEPNSQVSELESSLIDPTKQVMVVQIYDGIIKTILLARRIRGKKTTVTLEPGHLNEKPFTSRIPEFPVRSSAFIQRPSNDRGSPRLALLWSDSDNRSFIKVRQLDFQSGDEFIEYRDLEEEEFRRVELSPIDYGASHLIPIEEDPYGLLILGESSISYFDDKNYSIKQRTALQSPTIWTCWERIDRQRYLLADNYGQIFLLMLQMSDDFEISGWKLDKLGRTSQAHCLVYLDSGLVFVGSHQGDSQVIRINDQAHETIQTIPNLGPILDFTLMDMGNRAEQGPSSDFSTGQARIVTGSGTWVDGSLRSVRSGVGLHELGVLDDLDFVTHLFALRLNESTQAMFDSLLVSFVDETRIYHFDPDGGLSELAGEEALNLIQDQQTIYAKNVSPNQILQVTGNSMQIFKLQDMNTSEIEFSWSSGQGQNITSVSVRDELAAVCLNGKSIGILDMAQNFREVCHRNFEENQISCVHLHAKACLAGSWSEASVAVLTVENLELIKIIKITELGNIIPRSILVTRMSSGTKETLLISMADGHVVTFDLDPSDLSVTHEKATILGTRQADLYEIPLGNGLSNVFVSSEHPTLIYDDGRQLAFSAINHSKVNAVCPFDNLNFPDAESGKRSNRCIAIASPDQVTFANIDPERTTQVRPLLVNSTVRRLAYSSSLKAFGIGLIGRSISGNEEVIESSFKLMDEVMFKTLAQIPLKPGEIIESVLCLKCDDGDDEIIDRFVIAVSNIDETNEFKGRVAVLEVLEDRTLKIVTQFAAKQAVRCLAELNGNLVVAFESSISVYTPDSQRGSKISLKKRASHPVRTAVIDLAIQGKQIIYADLIKSITVLEYKENDPSTEKDYVLQEIAHHKETTWTTAVGVVDDKTYLVADAAGNLHVLQQNVSGVTATDKRLLMSISELQLGENVNRIRPIDVADSINAVVHPRAFLATTEGSLYLFGLISNSKMDLLISLQEKMSNHLVTLKGVTLLKYRAFRNDVRTESEPRRFVDGEFLERFLDCSPEVQEECVKRLTDNGKQVTVDEVISIIESLKRLR